MNYIDTINDYEIYEYSKYACDTYGTPYPTYGAFMEEAPKIPGYERCSMEDLDALMEWCENN